jgi:hypothetical protein
MADGSDVSGVARGQASNPDEHPRGGLSVFELCQPAVEGV